MVVAQQQSILLIRLGSLGDVIFTLPAAHRLRAAFPKAQITFLVRKEFAPLLIGFSSVNKVVEVDRGLYRQRNPWAIVWETARLLRQLRRSHFSLAIDLQGFGETAMLTWLSGAPHRWGVVYRFSRKWAYTRPVRRDGCLHPIDNNLAVLAGGGLEPTPVCNEFALPPDTLAQARAYFVQLGLDPAKPTLFLQPFTSTPHKHWPLAGYMALAQEWRRCGRQVLFAGGRAAQEAFDVVRHAGFAAAVGLPLSLVAGLVALSTLVLGGDTGLLHLAVALDKRVLMLMGLVEPSSGIPFGHPDWTLLPAPGQPLASIPMETVQEHCALIWSELVKDPNCACLA